MEAEVSIFGSESKVELNRRLARHRYDGSDPKGDFSFTAPNGFWKFELSTDLNQLTIYSESAINLGKAQKNGRIVSVQDLEKATIIIERGGIILDSPGKNEAETVDRLHLVGVRLTVGGRIYYFNEHSILPVDTGRGIVFVLKNIGSHLEG